MQDFCSMKFLFDTSFMHAGTGGVLSCSLSSSIALTTIILPELGLLTFLTHLRTEREVESVSEHIEGLVLRFIMRPDFRTVKLSMIWARERQTVEFDACLGRFDDLVKKLAKRQ